MVFTETTRQRERFFTALYDGQRWFLALIFRQFCLRCIIENVFQIYPENTLWLFFSIFWASDVLHKVWRLLTLIWEFIRSEYVAQKWRFLTHRDIWSQICAQFCRGDSVEFLIKPLYEFLFATLFIESKCTTERP